MSNASNDFDDEAYDYEQDSVTIDKSILGTPQHAAQFPDRYNPFLREDGSVGPVVWKYYTAKNAAGDDVNIAFPDTLFTMVSDWVANAVLQLQADGRATADNILWLERIASLMIGTYGHIVVENISIQQGNVLHDDGTVKMGFGYSPIPTTIRQLLNSLNAKRLLNVAKTEFSLDDLEIVISLLTRNSQWVGLEFLKSDWEKVQAGELAQADASVILAPAYINVVSIPTMPLSDELSMEIENLSLGDIDEGEIS